MSHVDAGPLAAYNSLMDPNLAGYFSNLRRRKHLRQAGLINRRGEVISENTYRINMARKEHKKHVRDLLAQAIVHKTLDMERTRQVDIKKKLEEIAKIELVQQVKASKKRNGDEELLPMLSPGSGRGHRSRPTSSKPRDSSADRRPKSAPAKTNRRKTKSLFVDSSGYPSEQIDDKHLYSLNSKALREYTQTMNMLEQGRGPSPYTLPLIQDDMMPQPPRTPRHAKGGGKSAGKGGRKGLKGARLHREEPPMRHGQSPHSLCEITMHYFGSSLKLEAERFDPREEVCVEQQHCGGNTLTVFKEKILPGSDFMFVSRRHRGYPFSITIYVDGVLDSRVSTCCEYKHPQGARLGGPTGHFGIVSIEKAGPCYKCQVNNEMKAKDAKKKKKKKQKEEDDKYEDEFEPSSSDDADPEYSDDHESEPEEEKNDEEEKERQEKDDVKVKGLPDTMTEKQDVPIENEKPSTIPEGSESEEEDNAPTSVGADRPVTRMERRYSSGSDSSRSSKSSASSRSSPRNKSDTSDSDVTPRDRKSSRKYSSDNANNKNAAQKPTKKGRTRPKSSVASKRQQKLSDIDNGNLDTQEEDKSNGNKIEEEGKQSKRKTSPKISKSKRSPSISKASAASINQEEQSSPRKNSNVNAKTKDASGESSDSTKSQNLSRKDSSDSTTSKSLSRKDSTDNGKDQKKPRKYSTDSNKSEVLTRKDSTDSTKDQNSLRKNSADSLQYKAPLENDSNASNDDQNKNTANQNDQAISNSSTSINSSDIDGGGINTLRAMENQMKGILDDKSSGEEEKESSQSSLKPITEESPRSSSKPSPRSSAGSSRQSVRVDSESPKVSPPTSTRSSAVSLHDNNMNNESQQMHDLSTVDDSQTEGERHGTESDMAGGYDPENVAGTRNTARFKKEAKPSVPFQGSLAPFITDKNDVDLSNMNLSTEQIDELCELLERNDNLQSLSVRNANIDDFKLKDIVQILNQKKNKEIEMINLNSNNIGADGVTSILDLIKYNPNLKILLMHGCPLLDEGAVRLVDGIRSLCVSPEKFEEIQSTAKDVVNDALQGALKDQSLQDMQMDSTPTIQQDSDSSLAGRTQPIICNLEHLELGDCGITDTSAHAISQLLYSNSSIATLNLTANLNITTQGWKKIFRGLAENRKIQTLILDYNNLTDEAMEHLSTALKQNGSLKSLDLEGNAIGERGGRWLLEALKENKSLTDITLSPGNEQLTEDLRKEIRNALDNN